MRGYPYYAHFMNAMLEIETPAVVTDASPPQNVLQTTTLFELAQEGCSHTIVVTK